MYSEVQSQLPTPQLQWIRRPFKLTSQQEIPQKSSACQFLQMPSLLTQKKNAKVNTEQPVYWTGQEHPTNWTGWLQRVYRNSALGNNQYFNGKSPKQPGLTSSWYWTTWLLLGPSNNYSFNILNILNSDCPHDKYFQPPKSFFILARLLVYSHVTSLNQLDFVLSTLKNTN